VSGLKKEIAELTHRLQKPATDADTQRALIEALPSPCGRATPRAPYVRQPGLAGAVEASDAQPQWRAGASCSTAAPARRSTVAAQAAPPIRVVRVIVAGARRIFDIFETPTRNGSAGIGRDATELETLRSNLVLTVEAHHALSTSSDGSPSSPRPQPRLLQFRLSGTVGDRCRIPRPAPFRFRRADRCGRHGACPSSRISGVEGELHQAYRPPSPPSTNGTCRTTHAARRHHANPDGGVTYLFDDVTERLNLERRFDALIRCRAKPSTTSRGGRPVRQ